MEREIFLEKNRSVFSNNVENGINVSLSTKLRLLPNDNLVSTFSLNEQYNKERDECSKYRVIFTVNPLCTNVLYNMKTEIMTGEGSDKCEVLLDNIRGEVKWPKSDKADKAVNRTDPIDYIQAMDDTEYSKEELGNFTYHCGVNIFNNHMLKSKNFAHVNKLGTTSEGGDSFNTFNDYLRDDRGKIVEENIKRDCGEKGLTKLHLYTADNSTSMREAFMYKCKEKDGWWGFTNPGYIDIPNNSTNRMLGNNKACEFIDLYPDRSLFSFVPKYNKYRQRIEKNWDYCLTYPYAKDYGKINEVCGGMEQAIRANINVKTNSSSVKVLECSSYFKHNLKTGDYVYFYYYYKHKNGAYDWQKYSKKVKVVSIGDSNGMYSEKIFSVKLEDVQGIYEYFTDKGCFYKRIANGEECNYYFRKFKKIDNFKSDINKVAFGENIYGDDVAQIIFTDTVDLNGLIDDNGRPISDVYLTIIKRNAGYKNWYGVGGSINDPSVEFSHCFGKVTSGLDFEGIHNEPFDYNIHYLHNMEGDIMATSYPQYWNTLSAWGDTVISKPKVLEDDITIEEYDEFYGDIVEFDVTTYTENIIGNVYHRVNTAQRETFNDNYRDLYQDIIISDDYDVKYEDEGGAIKSSDGFKTERYYLNDGKSSVLRFRKSSTENLIYGNISPEGYYYNPHTKISLRSVSDTETSSVAKYINYATFSMSGTPSVGLSIEIVPPVNYGFISGDYIAFYNTQTKEIFWGEISSIIEDRVKVSFEPNTIEKEGFDIRHFDPSSAFRKYFAFWSADSVPLYAKLNTKAMKFIWKKLVAPSDMLRDDALYDMPFSNGCFYIHKNINFFLKRQDPYGKYGLSKPIFKKTTMSIINQMQKYVIKDQVPLNLDSVYYMIDNGYTCY